MKKPAGLALSKLVSKLETGSRILDKNEFRVSKTSVDTSIDNLKLETTKVRVKV